MKTPNNISNMKKENAKSNEVTIDINNQTINTNRNNQNNSYITTQSKINKRKKGQSQRHINDNKYEKINNTHNQKQNSKNSASNLNSKLTPGNYIKPLYYLLNNQIKPINKQFNGFRYERNFIYNNFPTTRNNEYNEKLKYKSIDDKNEEKKENNYSKNKSPNLNKNKNKKKNEDKNKNLKNKNKNVGSLTTTKDINDLKNEKVTLIQANFRGYMARKNIYNSLSPYSKFRQDINTLEKIIKFKGIFLIN